ncbi:Carnitinyl-CoA dehydratase [Pseudovibrio axinellae]|uniref:Carnitinyl-CoA dehydratase n=1 Tax=Pseudovibrio axinellae TaxID=989403 RepID=A0A165XZG1_9HYPH|nr:crotonase/enoyl-CoA hydratase family protein [Pseudovibrio axinellae]KZL18268.1 Carnitinyl-CoA dehydratase [Pseudovibrio axinellae]SER72619.1 enoyl-CoA hydratase [Pseudovibrio axinellae]
MTVHFEVEGTTAIITLDRPERRNAVDAVTAQLLVDAFTKFDQDDSLSVAVFTGSQGTFCAGADLKAVAEGKPNSVHQEGDFAPMGPSRMRLSKPVIAAIEGHAVAGGLELALWADMRVAGKSAVFGVYCRRFGVPLIDMGTIRLPRLIGQSRASDMILTGRSVSGEEAVMFGLVNRLVEDGDALTKAKELALHIAEYPQMCMRHDRLSMYEQWDLSETEAIKNEMRHGITVISSGETVSGATAFSRGKGRHGVGVES